jgi:hypothetical protein
VNASTLPLVLAPVFGGVVRHLGWWLAFGNRVLCRRRPGDVGTNLVPKESAIEDTGR